SSADTARVRGPARSCRYVDSRRTVPTRTAAARPRRNTARRDAIVFHYELAAGSYHGGNREAFRPDPGLQRSPHDRRDPPAGRGGAHRKGEPGRRRRLRGRDGRNPETVGRPRRRAGAAPSPEPRTGTRGP